MGDTKLTKFIMAALGQMLSKISSSITSKISSPLAQIYGMVSSSSILPVHSQQIQTPVRSYRYVDWMMLRDQKRRMLVKKHAPDRLRVNSLRRNTILPRELQELADIQMQTGFPRQSSITYLTNRCVISSRPRGKLRRWKISRFIFRHLADYNKLSGVKRAHW